MPRKNKSKSSSKKGRASTGVVGPTVSRVGFKVVSTGSLTTGAATIVIAPATFPPVNTIAQGFEFYRVTQLKYRLSRGLGASTFVGAAFVAGVTDVPPSSISEVSAIPTSVTVNPAATVPTEWRNVPRALLKSYMPWFKTLVGTPDPSEEVQGNIFIAGAGTEAYAIEIEGLFELRSVVPIGLTPQLRLQKEMLASQLQLKAVLAFKPSLVQSKTPGESGVGASPAPAAPLCASLTPCPCGRP